MLQPVTGLYSLRSSTQSSPPPNGLGLLPVHHRIPSERYRPQEAPTPRHLLRQLVIASSLFIAQPSPRCPVVSRRSSAFSPLQKQSATLARLPRFPVAFVTGRGTLPSAAAPSQVLAPHLPILRTRGEQHSPSSKKETP